MAGALVLGPSTSSSSHRRASASPWLSNVSSDSEWLYVPSPRRYPRITPLSRRSSACQEPDPTSCDQAMSKGAGVGLDGDWVGQHLDGLPRGRPPGVTRRITLGVKSFIHVRRPAGVHKSFRPANSPIFSRDGSRFLDGAAMLIQSRADGARACSTPSTRAGGRAIRSDSVVSPHRRMRFFAPSTADQSAKHGRCTCICARIRSSARIESHRRDRHRMGPDQHPVGTYPVGAKDRAERCLGTRAVHVFQKCRVIHQELE